MHCAIFMKSSSEKVACIRRQRTQSSVAFPPRCIVNFSYLCRSGCLRRSGVKCGPLLIAMVQSSICGHCTDNGCNQNIITYRMKWGHLQRGTIAKWTHCSSAQTQCPKKAKKKKKMRIAMGWI